MTNNKELKAFMYFHPGETLGEELEARERTQKYFASLIHVSRQKLNDIIKGRLNITPRLAHRIGHALGTGAEIWAGLQTDYDLYIISKDKKEKKIVENMVIA